MAYITTLASSIIAKARIVNYASRIVIYSFIVLSTVITIVNYDRKTFIVQATGAAFKTFHFLRNLRIAQ